jgi:arsenite methyltransferase
MNDAARTSGSCCGSGALPGDASPLGPDERRETVRERYAALAAAGTPCCGSTAAEADAYAAALYESEELAVLPEEVRRMAMGCGNPAALANLRAGMTVVDLGSGAGIDAILAAHKVGPTGRVIGVDMTEEMLTRARQAAESMGLTQVEFRAGRIEELPIEDEAADVMISNCVINLSPEKGRVFSEAYRVLRLGGMLAVSDMVLVGALPPAIAEDPAAWSSCVSGAVPLQEYLALIREAGFKDPVVRELVPYTGAQVASFKEVDEQLFDREATLRAADLAALDGCLASARIVALKVQTCC